MKVIDLIYKIANGEEVPQKIIYEDELYEFREDLCDYENEYSDFEAGIDKYKYLFEDPYGKDYKEFFNDELEIIEDKKINKIKQLNNVASCKELIELEDKQQINNHILKDKINEIIDKINKEEKW